MKKHLENSFSTQFPFVNRCVPFSPSLGSAGLPPRGHHRWTRDPRTDLPLMDIPSSLLNVFRGLCPITLPGPAADDSAGAPQHSPSPFTARPIIHVVGPAHKVTCRDEFEPRVIFATNACVYVCTETGVVRRCIAIRDIAQVLLSDSGRRNEKTIGLRLQPSPAIPLTDIEPTGLIQFSCDSTEHDIILSMPPDQRDYLVKVIDMVGRRLYKVYIETVSGVSLLPVAVSSLQLRKSSSFMSRVHPIPSTEEFDAIEERDCRTETEHTAVDALNVAVLKAREEADAARYAAAHAEERAAAAEAELAALKGGGYYSARAADAMLDGGAHKDLEQALNILASESQRADNAERELASNKEVIRALALEVDTMRAKGNSPAVDTRALVATVQRLHADLLGAQRAIAQLEADLEAANAATAAASARAAHLSIQAANNHNATSVSEEELNALKSQLAIAQKALKGHVAGLHASDKALLAPVYAAKENAIALVAHMRAWVVGHDDLQNRWWASKLALAQQSAAAMLRKLSRIVKEKREANSWLCSSGDPAKCASLLSSLRKENHLLQGVSGVTPEMRVDRWFASHLTDLAPFLLSVDVVKLEGTRWSLGGHKVELRCSEGGERLSVHVGGGFVPIIQYLHEMVPLQSSVS